MTKSHVHPPWDPAINPSWEIVLNTGWLVCDVCGAADTLQGTSRPHTRLSDHALPGRDMPHSPRGTRPYNARLYNSGKWNSHELSDI